MKSSNPIERLITSPLCAAVICPVGGFAIWFFAAQPPQAAPTAKTVEEHKTVQQKTVNAPPESVGTRVEVAAAVEGSRNSSASSTTRTSGKKPKELAKRTATDRPDGSTDVNWRDPSTSIGQRNAQETTVQSDVGIEENKQADAPAVKITGAETPDPSEGRPPANAKKAQSSSPESVLESRGLQRSGKFYVVATEKEIGAGYARIIPIYNFMEAALITFQAILDAEAKAQYLDNERILAETYINDLNIALANLPNNAINRPQIQQLQSELRVTRVYWNDVTGALRIAIKDRVPPARRQAVYDEFMRRRADFLDASKQLRPIVDKAVKEYAVLQQDSAVKNALQTVAMRANSPASLGPSKDLTTAINKLRRAEEMVSFNPDAYRSRAKRKSKLQKKGNTSG